MLTETDSNTTAQAQPVSCQCGFLLDEVVLTLPQRKQCSILKTLPKSQEFKESAHNTQTRAGIKILKVNKLLKGSNAATEFFKPGNYLSQGGMVVEDGSRPPQRCFHTAFHFREKWLLFYSKKRGMN